MDKGKRIVLTHLIASLSGLLMSGVVQAASSTASEACPANLQHTFARLQDDKPQSLCQYAGKVILVVNTASYCGFTTQYKGLEALYSTYKDRGLVVLGFPSNDFSQEPGAKQQIADFCENTYGVKFPMFDKTSVVGSRTNRFYRQLVDQSGKKPLWNFHKYLLARDGKVVASFPSEMEPQDPALLKALEKQLAGK
jgi:glutathione peroxidase